MMAKGWLALSLLAALLGIGPSRAAEPSHHIAFFGFSLINTSLEATRPEEQARLKMLDGLFDEKLSASGKYTIVPLSPEIEKQAASGPAIGGCNGCESDYAKAVGADWAAWGTVQKVSNLILNINLYMEDAKTGKLTFVKSVDIRGNTDETWHHGLDYMLRHYLFDEP